MRETQRSERCRRIAEELNSGGSVINLPLQRAGVSAAEGRRAVEGETNRESPGCARERQATAGSENACHFPTSDDIVHPAGRVSAQPVTTTERKFPDSIDVEQVTDIEV